MFRLIFTFAIVFVEIVLKPSYVIASEKVVCELRDKTKVLTQKNINYLAKEHEEALAKHEPIKWGALNIESAAAQRESISSLGRGECFSDAILHSADLRKLNLSGSTFRNVDFRGSKFARANLEGAFIYGVNLSGVSLRRVNFKNATLRGGEFIGATFQEADLSGARFHNVKLNGAKLVQTNLSGTKFENSDVAHVIYEPTASGIPNIQSMSRAKNLHLLTYESDRSGLVKLKKSFEILGYREQERDVTYALKKSDSSLLLNRSDVLENLEGGALETLFGWTCGYGREPGKPLALMLYVMLACGVLYYLAILWGKKAHVWKVVPKEQQFREGESYKSCPIKASDHSYSEIAWFSMYLSLIATFRIGWRDLNIGTWISRSLPVDYTLVAFGWIKLIGGFQSVVSVYLIALSVLTYFGRPFE